MCNNIKETVINKYKVQQSRYDLAKMLAREGVVLLRNENDILPLNPREPLAVFGLGQVKTQTDGMGSGASKGSNISTIMEGLITLGFHVDKELLTVYNQLIPAEPKKEMPDFIQMITSGLIYEIWGAYNAPSEETTLKDEVVAAAARRAEKAIIVISRNSGGEECDRRIDADYYLQPSEKSLVEQVTSNFKQVIVILNINGFIDTAWVNEYRNVEALLYIGLPGEAGGIAVAEILAGKSSPSGKLTSTMAMSYEDYSTSAYFSFNKDLPESILTYESYGLDAAANGSTGFDMSPVTVYKEGMYVGYRYFDTFGKKVMFPFGYGLSYADFKIRNKAVSMDKINRIINVTVEVLNISEKYSSKEVVQVYVSEPDGKLEKPYQRLVAYTKTKDLLPGENQTVTISFQISELASYDEGSASYIIESGEYIVRVGNSSRNTHVAAKFSVSNTITIEQLSNRLGLNPANEEKIEFLSKKGATSITYAGEANEIVAAPLVGIITEDDVGTKNLSRNKREFEELQFTSTDYHLGDVMQGRVSMEQFVSQLTKDELVVLVNGHGKGVPFGGIGLNVPDTIQYEVVQI